jgi:16S rRNA (cytosine1402-N4)-methyltransferase
MHIPVMSDQVIEALFVRAGGVYFDGTFGRGGHSSLILDQGGFVLACDRDLEAFTFGQNFQKKYESNFMIQHSSFSSIDSLWSEYASPLLFDGVFFDFGVSSPQIDSDSRGFSFMRDAPLDMRFDQSSGMRADEWVNLATEAELCRVFHEYGEEKNASKIAKAIIEKRKNKKIITTLDLVKIVESINSHSFKHPATRIFQAIRIHINDELREIERTLSLSWNLLKAGGRLVVITFHSLEDRLVKSFFSNFINFVVLPQKDEIEQNPRARSAKLRYAIKESVCF